ncbi:diguanylate cyclase [Zoogloea sp.]|uniref:diguanylate cyclase domain-containing protein n=1 Tax=Zoogloea sp. TaxID=49181 RepID=UPI00260D1CA3|nr:diguanylate cyclase [Zoogloea sp.]MDD3352021.1 diguanylate cyclase [Zoogloea sp.]
MHVQTLFLVLITVSALLSTTLLVTARRRHPELQIWAGALLLFSLAHILLGLRGQISDLLSITGGNLAISINLALFGEGIYCFHRRSPPRWRLWLPVPLTGLLFHLLLDSMAGRLVLSGVHIMVQLTLALVPLWAERRKTVGHGQYVLACGAAVILAAVLARTVAVLGGGTPVTHIFTSAPVQSLLFFCSLLSVLLMALGMILMVQERTEQELLSSEDQYRRLIEAAQEGICILNEQRCRFANPRACELLGYSQAELLGKSIPDVIHPDDLSIALSHYQTRLDGVADNQAYDIRLITRPGGPRWFRISGVQFEWQGQPATLTFLTDIHERKEMEEQARLLAHQDALTQLPNRRLLMDRLQQAVVNHKRNGRHIGLMFMDLDNFKSLNDQHGHQVGDLLLIEVAQRLRGAVRESDTVARFGGDEFVVLLGDLHESPQEARQQALNVAEKVLQALSAPYVLDIQVDGHPLQVTHHCSASIGIHLFAYPASSPGELLDQADAAMYRAKDAGRGVIRFVDDETPLSEDAQTAPALPG